MVAVTPPLGGRPATSKKLVPQRGRLGSTGEGQVNEEDPVTVIRKLADAVFAVLAESLTSIMNWKVPVTVGVPEIVALGLPEVSDRPAGNAEPDASVKV